MSATLAYVLPDRDNDFSHLSPALSRGKREGPQFTRDGGGVSLRRGLRQPWYVLMRTDPSANRTHDRLRLPSPLCVGRYPVDARAMTARPSITLLIALPSISGLLASVSSALSPERIGWYAHILS